MNHIGITYHGGFALAQTPDELKSIIENTRNVTAKYYKTAADAYVELVNNHVHKCNIANIIPVFPSWEDWSQMPYFTAPNTLASHLTTERTFILWSLESAGVYDDIDTLISDFVYIGNLSLFEAADEFDAVNKINSLYKGVVYRAMPYIIDKIPVLSGPIPKNILHCLPYQKIILMAKRRMPEEIHNLVPYTLAPQTNAKLKSHYKGSDGNRCEFLIQPVEIIG